MFGSIGGSEVILLFILALLIFGPRKLPEIGRTLGKAMADFRRATNDFKTNLEREVQIDALKDATRTIESAAHPDALARGAIRDLVASAAIPSPAAGAAPAAPAAPATAPASNPPEPTPGDAPTDGGTDSVH